MEKIDIFSRLSMFKLLDNNGIKNRIYFKEVSVPVGAHRCEILFRHILVECEGFLIDNRGIWNFHCYDDVVRLDRAKLCEMLLDLRLWNNYFPYEWWDDLYLDIIGFVF